jgi:hypothetical protein
MTAQMSRRFVMQFAACKLFRTEFTHEKYPRASS